MKYLMATNTDYEKGKLTGAHLRFLELAKGLAKRDELIIISHPIPQLANCKNITFFYITKKKKNYLPDHVSTIISVSKIAKRIKDKIHVDAAISFTPFITIAFGMVGLDNIISLFREDLIGYHEIIGTNKLKIRYYSVLERIAVKKSAKIIVQCENDKLHLLNRMRKYHIDIENKVFVQVNNANASWMTYKREKYELEDSIRILFVGEFSNCRKGQDILLPVIAKILDENYKIKLIVAGDGKYMPQYKKKYEQYKNMKFVGRVDINESMKTSDILLVPSYIDSCPNVVLEGLNAGIAVYGACTGGIPDLLKDNQYMFVPDMVDLEMFLKNKIQNKRYISDAIDQKSIREQLTFDWPERMKGIIDA